MLLYYKNMLKGFNTKSYIVILLVAFIVLAAILAIPTTQVHAENTSVVISLNAASKFDAYADVFAYTYGTTLYVVKDNKIYPYTNAFVGDCLSVEINNSNILVLSKNGTATQLYYFSYDINGHLFRKLESIPTNENDLFVFDCDKDGNIYFGM